MPSEIIGRAESKVSGFRALRSEIEDAMMIVDNKLGEIREKIQSNVLTERNDEGFFTGAQEQYLDCLKVRHEELKNLLGQDEQHWTECLEAAKRDASLIEDKL